MTGNHNVRIGDESKSSVRREISQSKCEFSAGYFQRVERDGKDCTFSLHSMDPKGHKRVIKSSLMEEET
jgi:hypothetical protein